MKNVKRKIIAAGLALALTLALGACSVTKKDEKTPKKVDDTLEQSEKNNKGEQEVKSEEEKGQSSSVPDEKEAESFPSLDSVTLVNLPGDTIDVTKQSDGTYIDDSGMIYTFDGTDTWTDKDGHEWNEIAK